ncbi:MAG: hypothetical protein CMK72_04585 [Pseudomonadaceae bacterium]|nr:hypothetical protein [Pseudomonadaceae bacterium]HCP53933.1 hypothetical protein [Pseudomonas sp.]|tara:strand:+ start:4574 stop:5731 length:1158 start_codon:yes stop_codon:yes gene_type:complete
MFNPIFIYVAIWSVQLFYYLFLGSAFYPLLINTYFIILLSVIGFTFGASLIAVAPRLNSRTVMSFDTAQVVARFATNALTLYLISLVIVVLFARADIYSLAGGGIDFERIRVLIIQDFAGERLLYSYIRFFTFGVFLSIFLLSYARFLSKRLVALIFITGCASALLTTGRLTLLLMFVCSTYLFYAQRIIKIRHVVALMLLFVFLFFGVAFLLNKGGESGLLNSVVWNLKVYMFSSLSCFNDYVGSAATSENILIPNFMRQAVNNIFGSSFELKPDLNPFAYVPLPCNTYTYLYPIYNDGGPILVLIMSSVVGFVHYLLYNLARKTEAPLCQYLYAISLYPLVMTIFEDGYFSSFGFWLISIMPVLLFRLYIISSRLLRYSVVSN